MSSLEVSTPLDRSKADEALSDFKRKVAAALNDPAVFMLLLNEFKEYIVQYLALNQPPLSVANLIGFSQYTAQSAFVATTETTASTSYTNLTTTGPTLSGLSDGLYLIFHGCEAKEDTGGVGALMSYAVNGAAASDTVLCENANTGFASVSRITTVSLSAGANELVAKYRAGGAATASFASRFLIALRISNL